MREPLCSLGNGRKQLTDAFGIGFREIADHFFCALEDYDRPPKLEFTDPSNSSPHRNAVYSSRQDAARLPHRLELPLRIPTRRGKERVGSTPFRFGNSCGPVA